MGRTPSDNPLSVNVSFRIDEGTERELRAFAGEESGPSSPVSVNEAAKRMMVRALKQHVSELGREFGKVRAGKRPPKATGSAPKVRAGKRPPKATTGRFGAPKRT